MDFDKLIEKSIKRKNELLNAKHNDTRKQINLGKGIPVNRRFKDGNFIREGR